jgi:glyoxylase-like metal-dependent hydrolase (beta-lactamase superfamily II)
MKLRDGIYWYSERGFFDANAYVLEDELTLLIDPGLERYLALRLKEMREDGIDPKEVDVILVTHLHPDHCGATAALKEVSGAQVALHPSQRAYLDRMAEEAPKFFGMGIATKFVPDFVLGARLSIGTTDLEVIHTPGHSPCSISVYDADKKILICGDLVFEKGVGRTDLPFGDIEELKNSLEIVSELDTELLLPGHGAPIEGSSNVKRNYEFIKRVYFNPLF